MILAHALAFRRKDRVDENSIGRPVQERDQLGRERFRSLGFKPTDTPPAYGRRAGMATPAQVSYIRSLWSEYTDGVGDDRSLGKWLQRTVKVSDLRFVSFTAARKAITGLRAMVEKKKAA